MTDRPPEETGDFLDEEGPGSDPGEAYERAEEAGLEPGEDEERGPDIGDIYRSGS